MEEKNLKKIGDFNPLEVKEDSNQIMVTGTTFQYIFERRNGLISQIKVLDNYLLEKLPVPSLYLSTEIDPRVKSFEARHEKNAKCNVVKKNEEEVVIESEGYYYSSENERFPMKYIIEYKIDFDGVVEVSVNNLALEDSAIRWLCFSKGALRPDICEYLTHLSDLSFTERTCKPEVKYISFKNDGQILGGRFIPWFHFGNDYVGVEIAVCDASNILYGWTDTSPYKTGDPLGKAGENFIAYILDGIIYWEIFSLRNIYTIIYPGWRRENIFYLALVPAKHYNPAFANLRVHWEGPHQFRPYYEYPSDEKIKKLAQRGINLIVGCINYRSGEYSVVDNPEETRRVIENCHKYGIKIVPYVTLVDLEFPTEAFKRYSEDWRIEPVVEFNYRTNLMCYGAKGWREHWKREVNSIIDRFDFDGLYIDFWADKVACRNPRHGCNKRYMRFNLDGLREMLKHAYIKLKAKNPNLFILANTNIFPCAMANNFVDIRLLGEWWNVEETDPKIIRAFHNCFKFGCNNLLLTNRIEKITKKSVAFSQAYHGPMVMTIGKGKSEEEIDLLLNHANLLRFFGIDRAECINSFISKDFISRKPQNLIVSLYKNEMGLLLATSNLTPKSFEAYVRFKAWSKLGIKRDKIYLIYRPDEDSLLTPPLRSGKEASTLKFHVEAFSPALIYITEAPNNPKVLYASNFDHIKDERWDEQNLLLRFCPIGISGAEGQVTIYCSNLLPEEVLVDEKPIECNVKEGLLTFKAEALKPVEVKFKK